MKARAYNNEETLEISLSTLKRAARRKRLTGSVPKAQAIDRSSRKTSKICTS
ncbi:hypothetical protein PILCRDRAFT_822705 [Piloderma croceum F 1598]|uniref:Uncharacterized protein n=1 Tax=Piloderma croceum (strain F 1598) TaxID=765440 RepID=A0A0C3BSA0_PILCF|nr:hypothetical protein PILCRDRAFT_822705 [Piloderma croceum F 1598]